MSTNTTTASGGAMNKGRNEGAGPGKRGRAIEWLWLYWSTVVAIILCNMLGGATLDILRKTMESEVESRLTPGIQAPAPGMQPGWQHPPMQPYMEPNIGPNGMPMAPGSGPMAPGSGPMAPGSWPTAPGSGPSTPGNQPMPGPQGQPVTLPHQEMMASHGSPFIPFLIMAGILSVVMFVYERPLRKVFRLARQGSPIPDEILARSQRRTLNLPYVAMGTNLVMGLAFAGEMLLGYFRADAPDALILPGPLEMTISTVILTMFGFVMLEVIMSRSRAPVLFPHGGLSQTPGALRITLRNRLFLLLAALNLVPCLVVYIISLRASRMPFGAEASLNMQQTALSILIPIFITGGIGLTILIGVYLSSSLRRLGKVLGDVSNGDYDTSVTVVTNDELGFVGDIVNDMTEGLRDRERMKTSLNMAKLVQRSLMPDSPPDIPGYDIAGKCVYCDETGGDYFDFLQYEVDGKKLFAMVLVDVSGHGIEAALYMATIRAYIHQRAPQGGGPGAILTDVNDQLARDVGESGNFATCFYCEFDMEDETATWVRAGHDAGLLIDGRDGGFSELMNLGGLPLGVMGGLEYPDNAIPFPEGSLIGVGTDGIWECVNHEGEDYGRQRYLKMFTEHAAASTGAMIEALFRDVEAFTGRLAEEDDVTMVAVKRCRD